MHSSRWDQDLVAHNKRRTNKIIVGIQAHSKAAVKESIVYSWDSTVICLKVAAKHCAMVALVTSAVFNSTCKMLS